MKINIFSIIAILTIYFNTAQSATPSFEQAKQLLKKHVYFDQNKGQGGDFYCGCDWVWVGKSGGRIDMSSCGYQVRSQQNRAERTEVEHLTPAASIGQHRLCWQNGGRENCASNDPVFQEAYVDLFNLRFVNGEVNADRSSYRFGMIPGQPNQYGSCPFEVDFKSRVAEPSDSVKGEIARVQFYMHDRYNLRMSEQQQKLFLAWHKQYPVSYREKLLHDRTAVIMGHQNPYVTGTKTWQLGKGEQNNVTANTSVQSPTPPTSIAPIKGNVKSKIYHLSHCPSYNKMSDKNVREFYSEQLAIDAGYRLAGNCK